MAAFFSFLFCLFSFFPDCLVYGCCGRVSRLWGAIRSLGVSVHLFRLIPLFKKGKKSKKNRVMILTRMLPGIPPCKLPTVFSTVKSAKSAGHLPPFRAVDGPPCKLPTAVPGQVGPHGANSGNATESKCLPSVASVKARAMQKTKRGKV